MTKFYSRIVAAILFAIASIPLFAQEKLIFIDEGLWQTDNGRLSYFEDGKIISNQWFRDVNGSKLGDTPNDIIQVKPNLIAIAVNWSNIVQFIDAKGHAIAQTEEIPNNRKLATDGQYVYVTSYAHECYTIYDRMYFTKGYVAKIDASTFKVIDAVEVGYEPEGIAYYDGKLFVANSGGYSFQEGHDYEKTVSVVDAATMKVVRTVDTGKINLYGDMSQSGQYLCINSAGDYYDVQPSTVIFDCKAALEGKSDAQCCISLSYPSTYNTTATDGSFFTIGSSYSYLSGENTFNCANINPKEVFETKGVSGATGSLPGTVEADIKKMTTPYGIYVNPYTGYIYATDAAGYAESGALHQWTPQGRYVGKYKTYINPSHFLALNPLGESSIGDAVIDVDDDADECIYNLQGIRVSNPIPGQIYIRGGKKIMWR